MATIATPTEKLRAVWVNSGEVDRATWAERAYDTLHLACRLEDALRVCEYEISACVREDSVKANGPVLSALQTAYDAAAKALK